jgi:hypothetical protein
MHCFSRLYMHVIRLEMYFAYDYVQDFFLAKIQHHYLSSLIMVLHKHFANISC